MDLVSTFEGYVKSCIDSEGVYPFPMIVRKEDDTVDVIALAVPPNQAFDAFWNEVANKLAKEVILGLDRMTKAGQGTEFADCLTIIHWADDPEKPWATSFRIGVINYQNEPRIVRETDWANPFWIETMTREAKACRPGFRIKVEKKNG